jgi:hypothetical protein
MLYLPTLISVIEVLLVTVPVLLTVAYVTVAERKTMASMQRRLGPNAVGQLKLNFSFISHLTIHCNPLGLRIYNSLKGGAVQQFANSPLTLYIQHKSLLPNRYHVTLTGLRVS